LNRGNCINSHFTHTCSDTKLRWCFEEKNKDTGCKIVELHAVNFIKVNISHIFVGQKERGEIFQTLLIFVVTPSCVGVLK
jgi:hypothetical protein